MVTNGDGVLIPKRMRRGVKEVEISKERGRIVVATMDMIRGSLRGIQTLYSANMTLRP